MNSRFARIGLLLAVLSLTSLAAFSSLLHNHDFDFTDVHKDCSSCLWSVAKSNVEKSQQSDLSNNNYSAYTEKSVQILFVRRYHFQPLRAPPLFG